MKHKIALICIVFLLLAPIISFTLRQSLAADVRTGAGDIDSVISTAKKIAPVSAPIAMSDEPVVYRLNIEGAIGAVTDDRIEDAITKAEDNNAELLIITLDTPGGFTKPTWAICKRILNSKVPVCIYIAPAGARAGSAGVYMTYAANFAAMAPSTNIGAAHPVSGSGGDIDSVMNEKVTNDAAAQIRAAAEKRGRNAKWAERAVRESVSITATEALDSNVINCIAKDDDDLLRQLNGRETETALGKKKMNLTMARFVDVKHSFIQKFLEVVTSPDVAFILFSLGGLGIVLELYHPGAILPGIVGAICLILAFYAFQTLPINWAGVSLIIVAIILFILEIKVVSHGLLTIGGIISLFLGGLMLIDTVDPSLKVSYSVLITVAVLIGVTLALVIIVVLKVSRNRPFSGQQSLVGKRGVVHENNFVFVEGALWKCSADVTLTVGETVEITGVDQLTLKVKKLNP
ncbi:MAG TPA: nodulation protein NfeD [Candidatus Acidoferrum sp.]|nr:nodulation protein NfeD [Candidatus Acidoferrum sp.]